MSDNMYTLQRIQFFSQMKHLAFPLQKSPAVAGSIRSVSPMLRRPSVPPVTRNEFATYRPFVGPTQLFI